MTEGCPRNLCECDKRFAQAIASLDDECQVSKESNDPFDAMSGCQSDKWVTTTSIKAPFDPDTNPGPFNPIDVAQCDADIGSAGQLHPDKSYCCGIYPDRYPYDPKSRDCCEMTQVDAFLDAINISEIIVPVGTCQDRGGRFVPPEHMV